MTKRGIAATKRKKKKVHRLHKLHRFKEEKNYKEILLLLSPPAD